MSSRDQRHRQRLDSLHLAISVHNCANFTALFKNPYLPWRLIFYYGRGCVDIFWNYTSSNSVKAWGRGCTIFRKNSKKNRFFSFPYRCPLSITFHRKKVHITKFVTTVYGFLYFLQILLGIVFSWIISAIITAAGGFTDDPKNPQYLARTDARIYVLEEAKWFRFPYPG